MLPANADEAHLAVQCIAAQAQATDCIRLARRHDIDTAMVLQCNTLSLAMMRQASAARRLLLRVQAIRQKREANNATLDQAAWTEHAAMGLMARRAGPHPARADRPAAADPSRHHHRTPNQSPTWPPRPSSTPSSTPAVPP